MKLPNKSLYLFTLFLLLLAQPAFSQALLGISFQKNPTDMSEQMEEAFGNLITVHNYNDKTTLLNMLTKFNKLDAALITRQTYDQQVHNNLVVLADVQVSGGANQATLVLVSRSDLTTGQQEHLVQGYQELLLSLDGLELLERYATQSTADKPFTKPQAAPIILTAETENELEVKDLTHTSVPPVPAEIPIKSTTPVSGEQPVRAISNSVPMPTNNPALVQTAEMALQVKPTEQKAKATEGKKRQQYTEATEPVETTPSSASDKNQLWGAHIDIKGRLGNENVIGEMDLFIPLAQSRSSILFGDLRFQLDDNNTHEGNFGLGYRRIFDNRWVLGGYGFYDTRKSENNNNFSQFTIGAEALTERHDFRLNLYLAEDKETLLDRQDGLDQVVYSGSHLIHQTGGKAFETSEKPMSGFDAELGWILPWFKQQEVHGYLGGYHFSATGVEDITGPRGRIEVRFPDFFNWSGSLFEIGGEIRHDSVRDTDYFFSARARIPFGIVAQTPLAHLSGLQMRMSERVQRDPNIVIGRQHKDSSSPVSNEILTDDSVQITFTHVDSLAGSGDGSYEAPFNSLNSTSPFDGKIVLLYADSEFNGDGIILSPNQRLLGEPAGHSIITDQLGLITLPRASTGTAAPIITNTLTAVELAEGSEVSGISITDVDTAINGVDVGGININRVDITNVDNGIFLEGLTSQSQSTVITNNTFKSIVYDGISIYNTDVSGTVSVSVTDNLLQNVGTSLDYGVGIYMENYGLDLQANLEGNIISGTLEEGVFGENVLGGITFSLVMRNNLIDDTIFDGISVLNNGETINLYLQDNHVDGNLTGIWADYYIENNGTFFNLGATSGNPSIDEPYDGTDNGVINDEGNTRADGTTEPIVDVSGQVIIVEKTTIPAP